MSGVDSSYSWVVALAGSLISLLVSCPVRLGAQIFVSLLDRYDTTRKEASFPFVLAAFLRGVSGPFAGAFSDRIGLQGVTIFGCLLCSVGVGGCFFAEDVMTINICLGVIFGIGYGWSCALIPEIINQHFKKHRSIAYGITSSGGGLGSFFFPPILDLILKKFGVSGTFLIMAALLLNSVPAAMLLRKQKRVKKRANFLPLLDTKRAPAAEDKRISDRAAMQGISRSFEELCEVSNCEVDLLSNFQTDNGNSKIQLKNANMKQDTTDIKCPVADRKNLVMWSIKNFPEFANCKVDLMSDCQTDNENSKIQLRNGKIEQEIEDQVTGVKNYIADTENHDSDIKNHFTDMKKSERENCETVNLLKAKSNSIYELGKSESPHSKQLALNEHFKTNVKNAELNFKGGCLNSSGKSLFSKFRILWSPEFITLAFIQGVSGFVILVFYTIIVDFVRDKRIEQHLEAYFVMSLSLFDTIGRLTLGLITDKGLMTMENFNVCCFAISGFIFVLLAWLPEFFSIITIISLMGLTFGGITIAMPVLITKFIKKENRSMALASRFIIMSPMSLSASLLIGFFRGSMGSYDGLLYLMASMFAVCVILLLLLPILAKQRDHV